jgi:hypothetical protein
MKTIRRDILARGTAGLLKYLRSRQILLIFNRNASRDFLRRQSFSVS